MVSNLLRDGRKSGAELQHLHGRSDGGEEQRGSSRGREREREEGRGRASQQTPGNLHLKSNSLLLLLI